jgi:predicted lipoprotein
MFVRSVLSLGCLLLVANLAACDKKVIRERVRPSDAHTGTGVPSRPLPNLDGSIIIDEPVDSGSDADSEAPEDDAGTEPVEPDFTKANLISAVADCAFAAYQAFEERAQTLGEVTTAWAEDPTDAKAAEARAAFRAAMESFQRVEVFRFGPLAAPSEPGGKSLRDQVYSYPHNNLCKVDQQIVNQIYQTADFQFSVSNGRGLSALEYLEYYVGAQNSCSSAITINVDGSWAQLSADELKRRRADYAAAVARDIATRAKNIVQAFSPSGDDFLSELKSAGQGSKVYDSEQAALNAISNALFYVEIEVKDFKLALPLGISPDCMSGSTCPETVESPFARVSTSNIIANLSAFRAIFQGCQPRNAGLGFDDWLAAIDKQELADRMLAALDGAQAAIENLDPRFEQAIVEDPAKVRVVYDALKQLTDLLKVDFIGVLDLNLPRVAEGDND